MGPEFVIVSPPWTEQQQTLRVSANRVKMVASCGVNVSAEIILELLLNQMPILDNRIS